MPIQSPASAPISGLLAVMGGRLGRSLRVAVSSDAVMDIQACGLGAQRPGCRDHMLTLPCMETTSVRL